MLNSLKQALKQVLIDRQHKLYEKEVEARNLTYDRWIRKQEKGLGIASFLFDVEKRSQTNGLNDGWNDGNKRRNEGELAKKVEICHVSDHSALDVLKVEKDASELIFLSFYDGEVSEIALPLIWKQFQENENIILVYGDEDRLQGAERVEPWFKPDWSPDTFLSYFYFGGLVAVRARELKEAYALLMSRELTNRLSERELAYCLLFELIRAHNGFAGGHDLEAEPVAHIPHVLFHSKENGYDQIKDLRLMQSNNVSEWADDAEGIQQNSNAESIWRESNADGGEVNGQKRNRRELLSIVIPSKDNPKVLFQCIDSLLKRTVTRFAYEILVIDNGSTEENKAKIWQRIEGLQAKLQDRADQEKDSEEKAVDATKKDKSTAGREAGFVGIKYVYQPMTFNFSKMCNMGAEAANGNVLLFLNDDMEIIQPDWMELLMEKVLLPYVGAVGAKLLYPGTDIIQHAGITNLRVGPAHKLQYLSDEKVYYFGRNRGVHNMLAVTGACLMVQKEVFLQAGGFAEVLAVAFNDVDLCYTIHEMGYYNVQRNDVVLYHHESLSRGKDGESAEKQIRLQREKDILYERHQDIYGKDPFYHQNLTMDMLEAEYSPAFHYQVKLDMPWSEACLCTEQVAKAREDKCLVVGMECAMDLYKWQYGVSPEKGKVKPRAEDMGYYFQGYSFVIGADNACYKKKLLLKNKDSGKVFAIPMESRYRQDIKKNLKDQINVDLTGYAAKLQKDKLPEGVYQFGMLAEDACSRQKLVNWSNWVLEVKPDVMPDGREG